MEEVVSYLKDKLFLTVGMDYLQKICVNESFSDKCL